MSFFGSGERIWLPFAGIDLTCIIYVRLPNVICFKSLQEDRCAISSSPSHLFPEPGTLETVERIGLNTFSTALWQLKRSRFPH